MSELAVQRAECGAAHSDAPASLRELLSPDPHLWLKACQQSWLQGVKMDRWGVMDGEMCLDVRPPYSEGYDDDVACA